MQQAFKFLDENDSLKRENKELRERVAHMEEIIAKQNVEMELMSAALILAPSPQSKQMSPELLSSENDQDTTVVGKTYVELDKPCTSTSLQKKQKMKSAASYKYVSGCIRKINERDKLDAKPCHDCNKWYATGAGGVHKDSKLHRKNTCRHKHVHIPPDSDPCVWDIGFPDTQECERIMAPK